MTKKERQYKIDYEIIVDCYEDHEVNMGWYSYLEDNLKFPFQVYVKTEFRNGNKGMCLTDVVKIISAEAEEILFGGFYSTCEAMVRFRISDIDKVIENNENREVLNNWFFWKDKNLL